MVTRQEIVWEVMTYVLLAGVTLILIYEIWAIKSEAKGDTISELIWRASKRPIVPFAFGLLMGHLFW